MPDNVMNEADLEARLLEAPFNRWMGLSLLALEDEAVEIGLTWREEMISNPRMRVVHGGVLGALIDTSADFAVAAKLGEPVPTVDMRVDYHRPASPGNLRARARVVRLGSTLAVAETEVFDADGRLVASGRGTYFTAQAKR